jgi:hypothetical protein
MAKKTRPIGQGVRNITVTLPVSEVLRTEKRARISGVDRSPYIRTVVEWANDNGVIVRPEAESYKEYLAAIEANASPLPKIKYEIVLTQVAKPILVALAPEERGKVPGFVFLDAYEAAGTRVTETHPISAAASTTPAMSQRRKAG